jgi:hypothetical protein
MYTERTWIVSPLASAQEQDMHIGFNLPISGPLCSPEIVTGIAQEAKRWATTI